MDFGRPLRPTLKEVAVLAGTSIATASNVISGRQGKFVSEELRKKVLEAAADLGYTPNLLARSMKGKGRKMIAMLVPELYNTIYMRMVVGAERVFNDRGYLMLICSTMGDPAREEGYIQSLLDQQVDGFMLAISLKGSVHVDKIEKRGVPYVVLDRPYAADYPYDSVAFDGGEAVTMAVEHLYDKGHRRIGFIGPVMPEFVDRRNSFASTVARLGLSRDDCPEYLGHPSEEEGARLLGEFLAGNKCTALVIGHHIIGEHVVERMREIGLEVPRDVSAVIIGNPVWAKMAGPGFTAVELPHPELGEIGAARLIDRIEGSDDEKRAILVDCTMVERASVAEIGGKTKTAAF